MSVLQQGTSYADEDNNDFLSCITLAEHEGRYDI
jgi:hypothetical protein